MRVVEPPKIVQHHYRFGPALTGTAICYAGRRNAVCADLLPRS
jgi:hypothetical protein